MPTITYTDEELAALAHFAAQTSYGSPPPGAPDSSLIEAAHIQAIASVIAKHKAAIEAAGGGSATGEVDLGDQPLWFGSAVGVHEAQIVRVPGGFVVDDGAGNPIAYIGLTVANFYVVGDMTLTGQLYIGNNLWISDQGILPVGGPNTMDVGTQSVPFKSGFFGGGLTTGVTKFTNTPNTLNWDHSVVEVDATVADAVINLGPAAQHTGQLYWIKKIDATSHTVTIDPDGAELVGGTPTLVLRAKDDHRVIVSDGVEWQVFAASETVPSATTVLYTSNTLDPVLGQVISDTPFVLLAPTLGDGVNPWISTSAGYRIRIIGAVKNTDSVDRTISIRLIGPANGQVIVQFPIPHAGNALWYWDVEFFMSLLPPPSTAVSLTVKGMLSGQTNFDDTPWIIHAPSTLFFGTNTTGNEVPSATTRLWTVDVVTDGAAGTVKLNWDMFLVERVGVLA